MLSDPSRIASRIMSLCYPAPSRIAKLGRYCRRPEMNCLEVYFLLLLFLSQFSFGIFIIHLIRFPVYFHFIPEVSSCLQNNRVKVHSHLVVCVSLH